MVYYLLRIAIVLPGLSTVSDAPSHNRFFLSKTVQICAPYNSYDTPIQLYFCFVQ